MGKGKPEAEPDWDLAGEMCSLSIQVYELKEAMSLDQYGSPYRMKEDWQYRSVEPQISQML